jgi:hypothetical protein
MSEAELHVLQARLKGGILHKASRAALKVPLPVGLLYAENQTVILDPDAQIQQAVRLLFATFKRTGSAWATVKYFRTQGLLFPRCVRSGPHSGELHCMPLQHSAVRHPCCATHATLGHSVSDEPQPANILMARCIPKSFPRSSGCFSFGRSILATSAGKSMTPISPSCGRIARRMERIVATVPHGKDRHCFKGF